MPEQDGSAKLHFSADLHDQSLAGWGIRRRRGDLASEIGEISQTREVDSGKRVSENEIQVNPEVGSESDSGTVPAVKNAPQLEDLAKLVSDCQKCSLCETRTQTVFGVGDPHARLMFVGEAPGAEEDRTGEPFVGRAGQLLDKILSQGLKLTREQVYIANVLKCQLPESRDPQDAELVSCQPYLEQQIEAVQPQMIVALGRSAALFLTGQESSMKRMRGESHHYKGIPVVVTYHPAFLLRQPQYKADCWQDLQQVIAALDLPR